MMITARVSSFFQGGEALKLALSFFSMQEGEFLMSKKRAWDKAIPKPGNRASVHSTEPRVHTTRIQYMQQGSTAGWYATYSDVQYYVMHLVCPCVLVARQEIIYLCMNSASQGASLAQPDHMA